MPAQSTTKPVEFEGRGCRLVPRGLSPTAPPGSHPPGSAGVPPATLFLQAACRPGPLSLQGAPNPPLRGSLPSCRGLCGRDARAPRWSLCGRDARAPRWSLLLPPARPLAGPSRASSNALVALWPFFVPLRGYLFLSLRVTSWITLFPLPVSSRTSSCPSWIPFVDNSFSPITDRWRTPFPTLGEPLLSLLQPLSVPS